MIQEFSAGDALPGKKLRKSFSQVSSNFVFLSFELLRNGGLPYGSFLHSFFTEKARLPDTEILYRVIIASVCLTYGGLL